MVEDNLQSASLERLESVENSNQLETISKLRGGVNWTEVAWLLMTTWMLNQQSNGQVEGFQPIKLPHHEWLPGSHSRPPHQGGYGKESERFTVRSNESKQTSLQISQDPTRPQISKFMKNDQIDLRSAYQEVLRRTSNMDDFRCSFERFQALATECGEITGQSTREAISALQLEVEGKVRNVQRSTSNIRGIDFKIDGSGPFTHLEIKNPVGYEIKKVLGQRPSIKKQGVKMGKKIVYQKTYWSVNDGVCPIEGNSQSPNNILTGVDCFDVPVTEKQAMESAVNLGTNNDTDIIFFNTIRNK